MKIGKIKMQESYSLAINSRIIDTLGNYDAVIIDVIKKKPVNQKSS